MERWLPSGTKLNPPQGGYVLWVELPEGVDSVRLMEDACGQGISVAPGALFSAREGFANCIRLSCGSPWTPAQADALRRLGELADGYLQQSGSASSR